MSAKNCVSCNRLIASALASCTFCGAEQPAAAAARPKEIRCTTCKRPYSPKFEACPFCARSAAQPGGPPSFGKARSPRSAPPGSSALADDEAPTVLGSALRYGLPLMLGALWGVAQWLGSDRLGGEESSGLIGPSLVLALFVSPLLTIGFVRRAYGSMDAAVDEHGGAKLFAGVVGIAIVALAPTASCMSGLLSSFNGFAVSDRAKDVECKAGASWHRTKRGTDLGWHVPYTCDVDGQHLIGSLSRPERPALATGAPFRMRAARGRLGYWVRLEEPRLPIDPSPPSPPSSKAVIAAP